MNETHVRLSDDELKAAAEDADALPDPYRGHASRAAGRMGCQRMRNTADTLAWLRGQHEQPHPVLVPPVPERHPPGPRHRRRVPARLRRVGRRARTSTRSPRPPNWHDVPRGAPVFYKGPLEDGVEFGHIVTYFGVTQAGPLVWSNDVVEHGKMNMVSPLWFISHWGHTLLGWTGDLNDVDLHLEADGSASGSAKKARTLGHRLRGVGRPGREGRSGPAAGSPHEGRLRRRASRSRRRWSSWVGFRRTWPTEPSARRRSPPTRSGSSRSAIRARTPTASPVRSASAAWAPSSASGSRRSRAVSVHRVQPRPHRPGGAGEVDRPVRAHRRHVVPHRLGIEDSGTGVEQHHLVVGARSSPSGAGLGPP